MWKPIKTLVLYQSVNEVNCVEFQGIKIRDDKIIADKFKEFFIKSVIQINKEIPNVVWTNFSVNSESCFKFKILNSIEDLLKVVEIMPN